MVKNSMMFKRSLFQVFLLGGACVSLLACSGATVEKKYPSSAARRDSDQTSIYDRGEGIFGNEGLFSTKKKESSDTGGNIGVNTYLWRAALDTVSFMPLASADPFGGTILTDWYEDPEKPGERFKLNVLILDRELKSDGVRVRVFKQALSKKGVWSDEAAPEDMGTKLEDSILTRARQMRAKKLGAL